MSSPRPVPSCRPLPRAAALLAAVRDTVAGASKVADLFAGCGTFTLPLAEQAAVHAVEGLAAPLSALDSAWRATSGLNRVTTEVRDLARRPLMPDELGRFDAIVIDPPRAGAEAQMRQIAAARVPVVAAVSCDPVSFAKDARILADAGYGIDRLWVRPVPVFPACRTGGGVNAPLGRHGVSVIFRAHKKSKTLQRQ